MKRLLAAVLLWIAFAAQAAVYSLPWGAKPQFVDANGAPMSGGTLTFYVAGSTTPQSTYTDSTGSVANANPLTLNTRGEPSTEIWLTGGVSYKMVLKDSSGSTVWTVDNITGINDTSSSQSEWVTGPTPTYVSATSFTLAGDQTQTFQKGRRIRTTNSGGTVYSTITNSVFGASTTVTVANDSGSLDSGLSAVSYSLASSTNPSISPDMVRRKATAVASASTTDIWGIAGDFVHITGTTTITSLGTAPFAGAERTVIFDGALTLTHNATSLILPGAANITTAAGDRMTVRADTTANMIVTQYTKASGTAVIVSTQTVVRGSLAGLAMSTAGASTTMTVAAGQAADSTNAVYISLGSSMAKTTSAWVAGTAAGGLDTGAIANSTWYHFYVISKTDGTTDVLFSLSASSPTMPSGYTYKRRIGSGLTNGSGQWVQFAQQGDEFYWSASVLDVNATNPGTAAVSRTLTVPTGVPVMAIINAQFLRGTSGTGGGYISPLSVNDEAPSTTAAPLLSTPQISFSATELDGGLMRIMTNSSAQIRTRMANSPADGAIKIATLGWVDRRGRDD